MTEPGRAAYWRAWRAERREEKAAYDRAYNEANRERIAAVNRSYYEAHRDEILARHRVNRMANREEISARDRAYREKNPEKIAARDRAYHMAHHKEHAACQRRYQAAHPEKLVEKEAARRARAAGAPRVEKIDRAAVYERDGGRCHLCRKKAPRHAFHLDHLIPLSKGGNHTHDNLAVAHASCNSRRGAGRLPAQLRLPNPSPSTTGATSSPAEGTASDA